jgi:hypothetical protein
MSMVITVLMSVYYRRENSRRDTLQESNGTSLDDVSDENERDKGDYAGHFRYTV